MKAAASAPISSNEVDTSPGTAGDAGVVEQDHLAIPGQAVRHRRVPMVHRASEVLVEDEPSDLPKRR
jgi:hypothetical protein